MESVKKKKRNFRRKESELLLKKYRESGLCGQSRDYRYSTADFGLKDIVEFARLTGTAPRGGLGISSFSQM